MVPAPINQARAACRRLARRLSIRGSPGSGLGDPGLSGVLGLVDPQMQRGTRSSPVFVGNPSATLPVSLRLPLPEVPLETFLSCSPSHLPRLACCRPGAEVLLLQRGNCLLGVGRASQPCSRTGIMSVELNSDSLITPQFTINVFV